MNAIDNLGEQQVWQMYFPAALADTAARGIFVVPDPLLLLQTLQQGDMPYEIEAVSARFRLELSCVYLWPYVKDLFDVDYFPHLLAAATGILRASEFCDTDNPIQQRLAGELVAAMNNLEAALSDTGGAMALSAEPKRKHHEYYSCCY
jgi:hypothetical protein